MDKIETVQHISQIRALLLQASGLLLDNDMSNFQKNIVLSKNGLNMIFEDIQKLVNSTQIITQ